MMIFHNLKKLQILLSLTAIVYIFLIPCNYALADIPVSGTISENTTWNDTSERYVLNGDVIIQSGATLTIASGVEIYTGNDLYDIYVNGNVSGSGVSFTSQDTNDDTTHFRVNSGGDLDLTDCTFNGGFVRYYVGSSGGLTNCDWIYSLTVADSSISIGGSTIRDANLTASASITDSTLNGSITVSSGSPAISGCTVAGKLIYAGGSPTVTSNTFSNSRPLDIDDPDLLDVLSGTSGNTYTDAAPGILLSGTLESIRTLDFHEGIGYYVLHEDLTISSGATLTIASGVEIYTGNDLYDIYVNGNVSGSGVSFTSQDTNDDTTHFRVNSGGDLDLTDCTFNGGFVRYYVGSSGGLTNCDWIYSLTVADSSISIDGSTIRDANLTASVSITDSTLNGSITVSSGSPAISGCTVAGRLIYAGGSPTVTGNTFSNSRPLDIDDPDLLDVLSGTSGNTYTDAAPGILLSGTLESIRTLDFHEGIGYYVLHEDLTISSGATLTIASGVEIYTGNDLYDIYVNGNVSGSGVSFTSQDTNDDTTHFRVNSGGDLDLTDCTFNGGFVRYYVGSSGGLTNCDWIYSLTVADSSISIGGSTIRDANLTASASITDSTLNGSITVSSGSPAISGCTVAGKLIYAGGSPTVTSNTFSNSRPLDIDDPDLLDVLSGTSGNTYTDAAPGILLSGTLESIRTLDFHEGIGYYVLHEDLTISSGATLTIASGVEIYTGNDLYDIYVNGNVSGSGVSFTSQDTNDDTTHFRVNSGGDLDLTDCTFNGGFVRYYVGSNGGLTNCDWIYSLTVADSSISIDGSTIRDANLTASVSITDSTLNGSITVSSGSPAISGCTVAGRLIYDGGTPSVTGNTFSDDLPLDLNDPDYITSLSGTSGNTYTHETPGIYLSGTLNSNNILDFHEGIGLYRLQEDLVISEGVTLTIASGVEVYTPNEDYDIRINGTVTGSQAIFNDLNSANRTALVVYDGGSLELTDCSMGGAIVNYRSGSSGELKNCASIYELRISSSDVYIANCTLKGGTYGIYISDASPRITHNLITQNTYGVYIIGDSCPILLYNNIYSNSSYGIYNNGTCYVNAKYNWWGDESGPTHAGNPGGIGDDIYGDVNYACWVGTPAEPTVVYGSDNYSPTSADPVNTATGNFTYEADDLFIEGIGLNFVFSRSYNSQSGEDGPIGYGWSHSYNYNFSIDAGTGTATVSYGDGHKQDFQPDGSETYISPPDAFDTLTDNGDGTHNLTTRHKITYLLNDATGKLTSISDLNGNTITLSYDISNDLDYITDTMGRVIDISVDAQHRITSLTDPIGRMIEYEYDTNGDLIKATDARLNFEQYTYDALHQMETVIDKRGNTKLTMTYDASRVVTSQSDAYANPTVYDYATATRVTTITDADLNVFYHYYDANYRLIREEDPLGNFAEYTYDAKGNRTSVTDKKSHTTTYDYDDRGNVIKKTDPLGNHISAAYNDLNLPTRKTDEAGYETELTYDANGNLLAVRDALANFTEYTYNTKGQKLTETDPLLHTTVYAYGTAGYLDSVTNAESETTSYTYDDVGRMLTLTDPLSHTITYTYDQNDNQLTLSNHYGHTTTHTYDENDNLSSVANHLGETVQYEYDLKNRLVKTIDPLLKETSVVYDKLDRKISETNPASETIQYKYDAIGNLIKAIDANLNETIYEYDANGKKTKMIDAENRETLYEYDTLGRMTKVTDAANGITEAQYDIRGNLTRVIDPNNSETSYEYDELGQLTKTIDPLLEETVFTYDAAGNRKTKLDANGVTTTYDYDNVSRLLKKTYSSGGSVIYTYDAAGNRTEMMDSSGTTSYIYDDVNRLTQVTDTYGKTVAYTYDDAGRRKTLVYPGSLTLTYNYDSAGRLTSITDWLGTTTQFDYDDANRLTVQYNANGTTVEWGYDSAGSLTTLSNKKSDLSVISSHLFTLDKVGNRTQIIEDLPLEPSFLADQTYTFTHNDGHQVTSDGVKTFTYDAKGNRIGWTDVGTSTNYTFNARDRLTGVNDGTNTDTYIYNGDSDRIATIRNSTETRYVLDSAGSLVDVIAETDDLGNIRRYYIHGNGLLYAITPGTGAIITYHYDAIGNTMALTDESENVTDTYAYSPYGEILNSSGSTFNPFTYVGQYGVMKEENGLIFMRARFYDPISCRFLSKDPVKGNFYEPITIHPYLYSKASPVLLIDPSGNISGKAWLVGGGIVTMTAGVAMIVGGVTASSTGVGAVAGVPAIIAGYTTFAVGTTSLIAGLTFSVANVDDETAGKVYDGIQTAGDMASPVGMAAVGGAIATGHNSEEEVIKAAKIGGTANSIYSAGTGSIGDSMMLMQNGIYMLDKDYDASFAPYLIQNEMEYEPTFNRGKL